MRIVCSSCGKEMGEREPLSDTSEVPGICPECYQKRTGKPYSGISIYEKYLSTLDAATQKELEDLKAMREATPFNRPYPRYRGTD